MATTNQTTIMVSFDRKNKNFIVKDTATSEEQSIPALTLFGTEYKYKSGFDYTFLKVFDGKTNITYSMDAWDQIQSMIQFIREDC